MPGMTGWHFRFRTVLDAMDGGEVLRRELGVKATCVQGPELEIFDPDVDLAEAAELLRRRGFKFTGGDES